MPYHMYLGTHVPTNMYLLKKESRRKDDELGRKTFPSGAPKGICVQQLTNGDRVISTPMFIQRSTKYRQGLALSIYQ